MSALSESPQRPVKVTYANKSKRKRTKDGDSEMNASGSSEEEVDISPKAQKAEVKSKKLSDMKPPESTSRRNDTTQSSPKPPSEVSAKKHVRSSSSITSLKQLKQDAAITPSPSSSRKPPSARAMKPASSVTQNMQAPSESEMDDGASVADSIMSTSRVRRTEAERIAYFKNQPECDQQTLEPQRVKCLRCQKSVSLGSKQTYTVRPWELHRLKCDQKVSSSVASNTPPSVAPAEEAALSEKGSVRVRRTEAERKAYLLADPRAVEVKPDEVQCKRCQKWVRLSSNPNQQYALGNWNSHQERCSDAVPSSKVATAERKLKLVNDQRAKEFSPRHVDCASCGTRVALQGEGDYNLACWEQHKAECSEAGSSQVQAPGEVASTSTSSVPRPPPSVESTSTVVAPDSGLPRGTKRRLEEDDLAPEDPDAHVDIRPRSEAYVAPEKEPPSALGWFLMPIKSFIRGFKESLGQD